LSSGGARRFDEAQHPTNASSVQVHRTRVHRQPEPPEVVRGEIYLVAKWRAAN
jgi:hypothetical protein